jgi:glutathione S-transferase
LGAAPEAQYVLGMRLYIVHGCPFGHRAAIALREKRVPFEVVFFAPDDRPPELAAIGPRAKSPTLFHGDARVHDSLVVLEYVEDRWPSRALLPRDPVGRAQVRMLITRVTEELGPKHSALAEATFREPPDRAEVAAAADALREAVETWDRELDGREWLVADALSLADVALYPLLASARRLAGVEPDGTRLRAWMRRVEARGTAALPEPELVTS